MTTSPPTDPSDYDIRHDALKQAIALVSSASRWQMDTVLLTAQYCEYYLRTGRPLTTRQMTELSDRDQTVPEYLTSKQAISD